MAKLSNSVSVAELMHMREEEHLTNADIEKRLGISTKTVYYYIGKQPAGMRKPWGSNRKEKLPPLSEEKKELPEMPHESFRERLEMMNMNRLTGDPRDIPPDATLADIEAAHAAGPLNTLKHDHAAREEAEALSKKVEALSAPFDPLAELDKLKLCVTEEEADDAPDGLTVTPPPHTSHKGETDRKLPFAELVAVFGPETVRSYLRVALYASAVEHWVVQRSDMLKALETLNEATNRKREAISFD